MTGHKDPDPALEGAGRGHAQLQAEAAQDHAQAHLDIVELRLHQLARAQKRPHLLRRQRLQCTGRNQPSRISWPIPRASFLSVLTGMALKGIAHMARLQSRRHKRQYAVFWLDAAADLAVRHHARGAVSGPPLHRQASDEPAARIR
jgi:hypothetical protein